MLGTYTFKYYGVLRNFDLDKINKDTFPLMIESQIFDVRELSKGYEDDESYFGIEVEDGNQAINDFYLYNREQYHLKSSVLEDMYDYCESKCENFEMLTKKIRNVKFNLETYVSNHSKIKYLKQLIFDVRSQIIDRDYYLLYTKKEEVDFYRSWYEFFRDEQLGDEDYTYIFKYLKGERDFVPPFIKDLWKNFYYAQGLINFCIKTILHFERISGISEADIVIDKYSKSKVNYLLSENVVDEKEYNDIRLDIFRDKKSREAFDLIINKWKKPKNTAFYSKIFKFFQENGYIIIEGDDNETYREFILSNFTLESFKRIQKRTSDKENNSWDKAYSFFEDCLKKFTQNYE